MGRSIEVILGSPPERDELVAQLFHTGGGQWGEIYREDGIYKIELFCPPTESLRVDCEECVKAIEISLLELKNRLEGE